MIPLFRPTKKTETTVLERAPLEFSPLSTTTFNTERLNPEDPAYFDLRLRFRPGPGGSEADQEFGLELLRTMFLISAAVYLPPLLLYFLGVEFSFLIFVALPVGFALYAWFARRQSSGQSDQVAWLGAGLFVYGYITLKLDGAGLLHVDTTHQSPNYGIGLNAVAFMSLIFVAFAIRRIGDTYASYLRADSRFTPPPNEPKFRAHTERAPFVASGVTLCLLGLAATGTQFSVVMCLLVLGAGSFFFTFRHVPRIAQVELRYDPDHFAPGAWTPRCLHLEERQRSFIIAIALANLAIATATHWSPLCIFRLKEAIQSESRFGLINAYLSSHLAGAAPEAFIRTLVAVLVIALTSAALSTLVIYGWLGLILSPLTFLENYVRDHQGDALEWDTFSHRLRSSPVVVKGADGEQIRERDHLYLGFEPFLLFPVLLHRHLITEHVHILGDSGSSKTTLGLMPLLTHLSADNAYGFTLLNAANANPQAPHFLALTAEGFERINSRAAIVVLDLKGDMALFETARLSGASSFRYFTPEPAQSYIFNPFTDLRASAGQSKIQIAQLLLDALALNHGDGYGRTYYSKRNRDLMLHALEQSNASNFQELYTFLKDAIAADPARFREAFELVATVHALTYYQQLASDPQKPSPPEHTIHMPAVLEERQLAYFWLPSAVESVSVREIGKLALYALISAAIARRARGLPVVQTYLFIDEFQRIAGENFKVVLQQARSLGIGVILANQSSADLKTPAADLRSTVRTNTRVKFYFSIQDSAELQDISEASGLDTVTRHSVTDSETWTRAMHPPQFSKAVTSMESEKPRLTTAALREISDHPRRFVLHVSRGSGFTQFGGRAIPVEASYTLTKKEYDRRSTATWPDDGAVPSFKAGPTPQAVTQQTAQNARSLLSALYTAGAQAQGAPPKRTKKNTKL